MKTISDEIKEVLYDSFCVYASPTGNEQRKNKESVPMEGSDKIINYHSIGTEFEESIKGLLQLALSRLDAADKSWSDSLSKAYQIMAFNIAVIAVVSFIVRKEFNALEKPMSCIIVLCLLVMIFVGTKSALHCLIAITPKKHSSLSPMFLEKSISICNKQSTAVEEYLKLTSEIEKIFKSNDIERSIIAEHTWIATNCSKTQVAAVALLLIILALF